MLSRFRLCSIDSLHTVESMGVSVLGRGRLVHRGSVKAVIICEGRASQFELLIVSQAAAAHLRQNNHPRLQPIPLLRVLVDLLLGQGADLVDIERLAALRPPSSVLRVDLLRKLKLLDRKLVEQGVDSLLLPPSLGRGELSESALNVELASTKEPAGDRDGREEG